MLYYIIISVITIICILLTIVILLQPGQGQGISGGLAAGNAGGQGLGARRTADLLSKSTTVLGTALLVLCVLANFAIERGGTTQSAVQQSGTEQSTQQNNINNPSETPSAIPELPANQGNNSGGNGSDGDSDGGS
ncbi:preprotein translocase subunit SecG [Fodinibius saliphilus]|uniref:preprotein translocase subunit SecG n=1 Tax=Fodinibius saliphilus TaxID=1920650 RepID=UPI001109BA7A|nr:preprotein translocase subunit SecG [Fodinibius saliphilus]